MLFMSTYKGREFHDLQNYMCVMARTSLQISYASLRVWFIYTLHTNFCQFNRFGIYYSALSFI